MAMTQKGRSAAIATKLKKWIETAKQLNSRNFVVALPITRLTSIKSLCQDEAAAQQFALYICKRVVQQVNNASYPSHLSFDEWESHKALITDAIAVMESYYLKTHIDDGKPSLSQLLKQIDRLQGDDVRHVQWT